MKKSHLSVWVLQYPIMLLEPQDTATVPLICSQFHFPTTNNHSGKTATNNTHSGKTQAHWRIYGENMHNRWQNMHWQAKCVGEIWGLLENRKCMLDDACCFKAARSLFLFFSPLFCTIYWWLENKLRTWSKHVSVHSSFSCAELFPCTLFLKHRAIYLEVGRATLLLMPAVVAVVCKWLLYPDRFLRKTCGFCAFLHLSF